MAPPLVLFDIFDTVLTRRVASPEALFFLWAEEAARRRLTACEANVLAQARIEAEARARRRQGLRDPTLARIYDELAFSLDLPPETRDRLMQLEVEIEEANILAVPGARGRIEKARESGARIAFLSDMYLSGEFLRRQLVRHGVARGDEPVYVSCEWDGTKANGLLFDVVLRELGTPAHLATHVGDNPVSDASRPRARGLHVAPFPAARPNRYEEIMNGHAASTGGFSSVLAGAARLTRLERAPANEHEAAIGEVAASVAGPALAAYVLWVLNQTRELSLRRLYFVSRDGEILLRIARELCGGCDPGFEMRYLHGSRQAWQVPAIEELGDAERTWLTHGYGVVSARMLCRRVGLTAEEIGDALSSAGFGPGRWDEDLIPEQRSQVFDCFTRPAVWTLIHERIAKEKSSAQAYLAQEGLCERSPWGLVDLGWHGRGQKALAKLLGPSGAERPHGFYWGLLSSAPPEGEAGWYHAFMFDQRHNLGDLAFGPYALMLLEVFCTGAQGVVLGYTRKGERTEPVLSAPRNEPALCWGLGAMQDAICGVASKLCLQGRLPSVPGLRMAVEDALAEFWMKPTRAEAEAWGAFPYEDDQTSACQCEFAPAVSAATLASLSHHGGGLRSGWRPGSKARSSALLWGAYAFASRARSWARRACHLS